MNNLRYGTCDPKVFFSPKLTCTLWLGKLVSHAGFSFSRTVRNHVGAVICGRFVRSCRPCCLDTTIPCPVRDRLLPLGSSQSLPL